MGSQSQTQLTFTFSLFLNRGSSHHQGAVLPTGSSQRGRMGPDSKFLRGLGSPGRPAPLPQPY